MHHNSLILNPSIAFEINIVIKKFISESHILDGMYKQLIAIAG